MIVCHQTRVRHTRRHGLGDHDAVEAKAGAKAVIYNRIHNPSRVKVEVFEQCDLCRLSTVSTFYNIKMKSLV